MCCQHPSRPVPWRDELPTREKRWYGNLQFQHQSTDQFRSSTVQLSAGHLRLSQMGRHHCAVWLDFEAPAQGLVPDRVLVPEHYAQFCDSCVAGLRTASNCTVLYCTVLFCVVLYCIVSYCAVLYCSVLYCAALDWTLLYRAVL